MQPAEALRRATWIVCVAATLACAMLLLATGTAVAPGSLAAFAVALAVVGGFHHRYRRHAPEPRLAAITGGVAALTWAGGVAAVTALAALRTGMPLIDPHLAAADYRFGIDTAAITVWLLRHGVTGLLAVAYVSTVPLLFLAVFVLGWRRWDAAVWELCLCFAGGAAICTLISAVIPAIGAFPFTHMPTAVTDALPLHGGVFYVKTFQAYRSGLHRTIALDRLEGVVTFPSFHTVMALILAYAARVLPRLRWPVAAWSGLTILATIPIGGHYVVDLLAGVAVWLALIGVCRHLTQGRLRPDRAGGSLPAV